jgi:hypothetical protein
LKFEKIISPRNKPGENRLSKSFLNRDSTESDLSRDENGNKGNSEINEYYFCMTHLRKFISLIIDIIWMMQATIQCFVHRRLQIIKMKGGPAVIGKEASRYVLDWIASTNSTNYIERKFGGQGRTVDLQT